MWNRSSLRIQNTRIKTDQVLRGWNGDGGGAGRVKGTSSETTMQICRHFVWQATTPLCIYAKPGKTLCTQPCCQSRVMLEWWHPMDDPCLQRGYWARPQASSRQTHMKHWPELSHTAHITSQGSNVAEHWDRPLFPRHLETSQKLNNLISGACVIPAEVKSTWLALWIYSAGGLFGHL